MWWATVVVADNTLREPQGERRGDFILKQMNPRPFVLRLSKHAGGWVG